MFCPRCGTQIADDDADIRFCPKCGGHLYGVDQTTSAGHGRETITPQNSARVGEVGRLGEEELAVRWRSAAPPEHVRAVDWSPDGRAIVVCSTSEARVYDAASLRQVRSFPIVQGSHAAFSPGSSYRDKVLASVSFDTDTYLYDVATGRTLLEIEGRTEVMRSAAFCDDLFLALGDNNGGIELWDVPDRHKLYLPRLLRGHSRPISCLAFGVHQGSRLLASGSWDDIVRVWYVPGGELIATVRGPSEGLRSMVFSPGREMLACGCQDDTIRLWEVPRGEGLMFFDSSKEVASVHSDGTALAFSPDGRVLASGEDGCGVRLWDVATVRPLHLVRDQHWGLKKPVTSLAFSPDGRMLVVGDADGTVRILGVAQNPQGNSLLKN